MAHEVPDYMKPGYQYAYCNKHKVSWNYLYRENCLECMDQLELDRPLTDEEAMQAGYPHKPMGNDDRYTDTY